jgi:hypothetical protein
VIEGAPVGGVGAALAHTQPDVRPEVRAREPARTWATQCGMLHVQVNAHDTGKEFASVE